MGLDLINHPELLEQPENAAISAAHFWKQNGLNRLADRENFDMITKKINGGYKGKKERDNYKDKALEVLKK